jgi:hypothetical protein
LPALLFLPHPCSRARSPLIRLITRRFEIARHSTNDCVSTCLESHSWSAQWSGCSVLPKEPQATRQPRLGESSNQNAFERSRLPPIGGSREARLTFLAERRVPTGAIFREKIECRWYRKHLRRGPDQAGS